MMTADEVAEVRTEMSDDPFSSEMCASSTVPKTLENLAALYGRETVVELVDIYIRSSLELIGKIESAQEAANLATLSSQAHSLKSSSANVGAMLLSETCKRIEKSKSMDHECMGHLTRLREEWPRVLAALEDWKKAASRSA